MSGLRSHVPLRESQDDCRGDIGHFQRMKSGPSKRNLDEWKQKTNHLPKIENAIYFSAVWMGLCTHRDTKGNRCSRKFSRLIVLFYMVDGSRVSKGECQSLESLPCFGRTHRSDISLIIITFMCNWTSLHLVVRATEGRYRREPCL